MSPNNCYLSPQSIHRLKGEDEPVRDTVSFTDGAELFDDDDVSGPTATSGTTTGPEDGSQPEEETELPLIGGKPRPATGRASLTDPDDTYALPEDRIRKAARSAEIELDESLIDRRSSLEETEIDSREFGLSLESEEESGPINMTPEVAATHGKAEEPERESDPARIAASQPVELDADLNFPEVLIALNAERNIEPADGSSIGSGDKIKPDEIAVDEPAEEETVLIDDDQGGEPEDPDDRAMDSDDFGDLTSPTLSTRFAQLRQKQFLLTMPTLALVVLLSAAVFTAFILGSRGPYLKQRSDPPAQAPTTPPVWWSRITRRSAASFRMRSRALSLLSRGA